jgi:two-component system NarL family sensor kinase
MSIRLDSDALLCQALIWLLLVGYIVIAYVVVVAAVSLPFDDLGFDFSPTWWQNLVALTPIVLTFLPVHRWVRGRVRELVYSYHENPYPVLIQLNQQFDSTPTPEGILPTIAETIAHTLKLPFVEIKAQIPELQGGDVQLTTSFGAPPKNTAIEQVPLTYQGMVIGELSVASRGWDEPLSHSGLLVLRDLARQVGIALYAAHLTENLQNSRERLVIAREEERRRIRNDLHDGLAPTLSSLQLQLGVVRKLVNSDPDRASAMIDGMREDLSSATGEIRRLVYDLRPPMLDELGLMGAIKSIKLQDGKVNYRFIAPDPLPALPAALEVAVYRIVSEAMHNVTKHAQATECLVRVEVGDGYLTLSVTDNGKSIPHQHHIGVGLHSMQERAAELGGALTVESCEDQGTCLTAKLPIEERVERDRSHGET